MGINTCVDCGKAVSDIATACPHCGRPREGVHTMLGRANGQHGATKVLSILLILVGLLMFVSSLFPVVGAFLVICGVVCLIIGLATDKPRG